MLQTQGSNVKLVTSGVLRRPLQRMRQELGHLIEQFRGIPRHLHHVGRSVFVQGAEEIENRDAHVALIRLFVNVEDVEKEKRVFHELLKGLKGKKNICMCDT